MPRKIPPLDLDDLVEKYRAGVPVADLARELGVNPTTIYDRLRSVGVVQDRRAHLDPDEVVRLYQSGMGVKEIGRKFGASDYPVRTILKERGIRIRGRIEQMQVKRARLAPMIVDRYAAGESAAVIAADIGYSVANVCGILRASGVMARGNTRNLPADQIVAAYSSGRSANSIAAEHGVTHKVVARILRQNGVESFRGTRLDLPTAEVASMYRSGLSENVVAKRLGISRSVVRRCLIEAGVPIRSQSEAEALKWSGMTDEQRQAQVAAAHEAARGREHTFEERCKRAETNEARQNHVSHTELRLGALLRARGFDSIPQKAIGPYNCDLAVDPVAVEIYGGGWHWHGHHLARTEERFRHILDSGWNILAIGIDRRHPLTAAVADYVAAHVQALRRDPPAICEYRVVRGAGHFLAAGRADDDQISIIPTLADGLDL